MPLCGSIKTRASGFKGMATDHLTACLEGELSGQACRVMGATDHLTACLEGEPSGQACRVMGATDPLTARLEGEPSGQACRGHGWPGRRKMEDRGFEPLTFWLPARRSPN